VSAFDVVIIGGGVHGLSTAWHLSRDRSSRIAIVEQFKLGHERGSSHGSTRITRSSYSDAAYVELVDVARREDWPALERDAGETLVQAREGIFFGPRGGVFDGFVAQQCDGVELVAREAARARFPSFAFPDSPEVLIDRTAGVIDAEATLAALTRTVAARGVEIIEETRVTGIAHDDPIRIETETTALYTKRLVIAAGPWAPALVPELASRMRPVRQHVGFYRVDGELPVWAHLGETTDRIHYGLPAREAPLKAARHAMAGSDDPDERVGVAEAELCSLDAFLRSQLAIPVERVSGETCFFTVTDTEDYVLDLHPRDPRVAIGAGFSGHGFKLAPTSGRILAELVMRGKTSVEPFERRRAKFAIG
jgi:monomeric sarcosine oxidase